MDERASDGTGELVQAAAGLHRARAERSVPLEEREAILAALAALARALTVHAAVSEDPAGLLAEIRAEEPRLTHATGALVADHDRLAHRITELRERTALGEPLDAVRAAAAELEAELAAHQARTVGLVYDAFTTDRTGGDA